MPTTMSIVYYNFYLNMWIMRRITAEQLQTKVPKYLTQTEYEMIIATPQIPE
jgi:hypothetical protein